MPISGLSAFTPERLVPFDELQVKAAVAGNQLGEVFRGLLSPCGMVDEKLIPILFFETFQHLIRQTLDPLICFSGIRH